MKKEDIPQDKSPLVDHFPELVYGKNDKGEYDTAQSTGWDVKTSALNHAWEDIQMRVAEAKTLVDAGKRSPIYFYMEKNLMTLPILASYMKISPIRVWWHLRPMGYRYISKSILKKYAEIFKIDLKELSPPNNKMDSK